MGRECASGNAIREHTQGGREEEKIGDKKRIRRERKKGGKEVREGMRAKEEGFSP